ncbi:hypothetical protein Taro_045987 [Colocasia esculenta]|uniref:Uncharacterized protein n=1 Tax=Colocasia esculenta TaxID=4460 RepID=A0A843X5J2_COLES|nr:hypothetical protein [Colocasia esculenta]
MVRAPWPVSSLLSLLGSYPEVMLAIACFFVLRLLNQKVQNSKLPLSWPVVGMLPYLITQTHRIHDWCTEILRESGYTFRFQGPWFAGGEVVITCDPANVNHVFNVNFANYPKGEDFGDIFDILGNGIFNADAESWKNQRRMAHSLINHAGFRAFVARASRDKVSRALLPLLQGVAARNGVVDLQEVFMRFTFDSTCSLIFGSDPGSLSPDFPRAPFALAMDDAEEVILTRHIMPKMWWVILRWVGLGTERKFAMAWETIDRSVAEYVSRKREAIASQRHSPGSPKVDDGEEGTDLLTSYLRNQAEAGKRDADFDKFLRDTTLNLMIAGRDTTSSGLAWFFWLVSTNPDVEAKLLEELHGHLSEAAASDPDALVVFDPVELNKMVYLHAALCESLRLYPPVPFERKNPVKAEVLPSGIKVYEWTRVVFSLYAMGRMEGIWGKDYAEFRPERWISEKGKVKYEPSYKFLSFNAGPRTCLGKDVAFTQMKAVAAAMIYNFQFEVVQGHHVAPKVSIILHMENGLKVRVKRRRTAAAALS